MRGGAKGPLVLEEAFHESLVGSKVVDALNHAIGTKQIISKSREIASCSDALSYLIELDLLLRSTIEFPLKASMGICASFIKTSPIIFTCTRCTRVLWEAPRSRLPRCVFYGAAPTARACFPWSAPPPAASVLVWLQRTQAAYSNASFHTSTRREGSRPEALW